MNIEIKDPKKENPEKEGLYFIINTKGFVSIGIYKNNKWECFPFLEKEFELDRCTNNFYWINF